MFHPEIKVRIIDRWDCRDYAIYFIQSYPGKDRRFDVIYSDRIETHEEGDVLEKPSLVLSREGIIAFLEEAARLDFFQEKVKESESVLSAKENHLQDMRKLVFKEVA